MLHAHTHQSMPVADVPPSTYMPMPRASDADKFAEPDLRITHSTVCLNGKNICRQPTEVSLTQIVEAIRLAELRGKSELLLVNVTPWINISLGKITSVPETQSRIEELLRKACLRLKRDVPEVRLSLRGGEFDVRCYLGREKPTDFVFEDDWLSDSR